MLNKKIYTKVIGYIDRQNLSLKIVFLDLFLIIGAILFLHLAVNGGLTQAQGLSYPSGCSSCTGAGSWCIEDGSGYHCGGGANCGGRVSGSSACPSGCSCGRYSYIGGSISCGNDCILVESCGGSSTPPPPPPLPGGGCTPASSCSDWCTPASSCPGGWTSGTVPPCSFAFCSAGTATCVQCAGGGSPPPPPPPPPPPSCSISLSFVRNPIESGESTTARATVSVSNGSLSSLSFASSNTSVATVAKIAGTASAAVYADGAGTASITAAATATGSEGSATCSTAGVISVNPAAWWQVKDGDVLAFDNLSSKIPTNTCYLGIGCNPAFDLKGAGGFPGLPIYGGASYDFSDISSSKGTPAEDKNWIANSGFSPLLSTYNYAYFARLIPSDVVINPLSGNFTSTDLASGTASPRGYRWYKVTGDATFSGDLNIAGNEKVVLLVDGGNFTIPGDISIQSPGNGFFMAIVGKDSGGNKGDIIVSSEENAQAQSTPSPAPVTGRRCGQTCGTSAPGGGLCGDGISTCRYVNGPACAPTTLYTYCIPDPIPTGWSIANCTVYDRGNSYVKNQSNLNPTPAEIQAACNAITNPATPAGSTGIDGLFLADGQFKSGTVGGKVDKSLDVHGAVSALSGVLLERDLGNAFNLYNPAEFVEYAPEIVALFPRELLRDRIVWREVAP